MRLSGAVVYAIAMNLRQIIAERCGGNKTQVLWGLY